MNSVEQLIRQKLSVALDEAKRNIAKSLIEEPEVAPDDVADKKKAQQLKIDSLKQKLTDLQMQTGKAKDPAAMQDQLTAIKQKIQLANQDMSNIK
jgi:hypothetical protein